MKGPRSRHKFAIHRTWECPVCKKRVFTAIHVVNRLCHCAQEPAMMRLIDEPPSRRRSLLPPLDG